MIVSRRPLLYRHGADPALDRPAHVRAASALVWLGERLVVIQDDALFLGLVDPATVLVHDVPFGAAPRTFDARRGNKADKPDLEAAFVDDDTLIAIGSGGPIAARQVMVRWRSGEEPEMIARPRFFDALAARVCPDTALNLEGAVLDGDTVILANRGGDRGRSPDALIRIPLRDFWRDDPTFDVEIVDLGTFEGAPLHFADLAPHPDGILYLAVAEDTASYFDDGAVAGSVVGRLGAGRLGAVARDKLEGIAAAPDGTFYAVTDPDDPDLPGHLLNLRL